MNNEPQTPPGEALALARFALIAKLQDLLRQGFPLSLALEHGKRLASADVLTPLTALTL